MKKSLRIPLIICLLFIFCVGAFHCVRAVTIKNIFDEMYFGTEDILGGYLTSTSWTNMDGMAKNGDAVKYAVPGEIRIGFSQSALNEDEGFQIIWETKEKRLVFIYSVSYLESEHVESAVLDIAYSPYQKHLEIYPLRIVSCQNIYGDTSREAINRFFDNDETSKAAYYKRFSDVFQTALIENWRTGNPSTLFPDTLGEFEITFSENARWSMEGGGME